MIIGLYPVIGVKGYGSLMCLGTPELDAHNVMEARFAASFAPFGINPIGPRLQGSLRMRQTTSAPSSVRNTETMHLLLDGGKL